jgi:hypothetical protein
VNPLLLEDLLCPNCGSFPLRPSDAVYDGGKVESGVVFCDRGHSFLIVAYVLDLVRDPRDRAVSDMYDEMWQAHASQIYAGRQLEYEEKFRNDSGVSGDLGP